MYTNENTSRFSFRNLILQFLFIALFIFILLWLFPMKGDFNKLKSSVKDLSENSLKLSSDALGELNLSVLYDRIFNENIISMKEAAKTYYTTARLPQKVGETAKMTLKEMLSKKIILPFVDKNGKTCDTNASYVEITKYNDEFVMKINLKCSDQENYLLVYMGCYDYCQTAICEKDKADIKTPVVYPSTKPSTNISAPTCSLAVESGKLGNNGFYTSDVVVKFKSKTAGSNATLTGYGLGTSTNYNKATTYKVTKNGTTTVYGYVKNSNGKTARCSITIKKNDEKVDVKPEIKAPTCSLQVVSGTKVDNNTYKSNIVIGFKSAVANTEGSRISGYGLGTSTNYNGNTSYTVNADGTTTVYGYVKDSNGTVGSCSITVKKITETVKPEIKAPTCSLQVVSGTKVDNNTYKSNIVIGFKSAVANTEGSRISGYGLGTSTNYNGNTSYTVNADGTTTVYGYVKDSNGTVGSCSITVKKITETVKPEIYAPVCTLRVFSGTKGDNDWYRSPVVVKFASMYPRTQGANIASYSLGTSVNYNNNESYTVNADGTTTIYGYVKDTNGTVGSCSITIKKDATAPTCTLGVGKGTLATDGKYISDVLMGFKTRNDATSGVASYGLGFSKNYNNVGTYTLTGVGTHSLNGYVKDKAGNETICSRTIAIRKPLTTQTVCSWSNWSDWSATKYEATSTREVQYRTIIKGYNVRTIQDTTKPIFTTKKVYVGSTTTKVCNKYNYTGTITYSGWTKKARIVTSSSSLSDTNSVKYVLVGTDDYYCNSSGTCGAGTFYVWDVYEKSVASSTGTYSCASYTTVTTAKKADKTILTGYETKQEKTPVYETQYSYRTKTCTTVTK